MDIPALVWILEGNIQYMSVLSMKLIVEIFL